MVLSRWLCYLPKADRPTQRGRLFFAWAEPGELQAAQYLSFSMDMENLRAYICFADTAPKPSITIAQQGKA